MNDIVDITPRYLRERAVRIGRAVYDMLRAEFDPRPSIGATWESRKTTLTPDGATVSTSGTAIHVQTNDGRTHIFWIADYALSGTDTAMASAFIGPIRDWLEGGA